MLGLDTQPLFGGGENTGQSQPTTAAWPHMAAGAAGRPGSGNERTDAESGYLQRTGTAAGCTPAVSQSGFTPNQYLTAYNYAPLQASGLEGQGERVALIEIDGFRYRDLRSFAKCFGLATPAINGYGVGLKGRSPPAASRRWTSRCWTPPTQAQGRRRLRVAAERRRRAAR